MNRPKPVVLAILDGWGIAPPGDDNAIYLAKTPNYDKLIREYPVMAIYTSGTEVGLSFGKMGNSEVGHLNIGAGRVYYQTLPRIDKAIADKSFFDNKAFAQAVEQVKKNNSKLHIVGLVSSGNVHASQEHCNALLDLAKKEKIKDVYIHAFLDGRDATKDSGIDFINSLQKKIKEVKIGKIASLCGRYYALDRDNRWDRTEKAYQAIAEGKASEYFKDPIEAIKASYKKEIFDEEFLPTVIGREGNPTTKVDPGDAVIFFNFRPDRARQLTKAFVLPGFEKFKREYIRDITFVTMTEYEKEIPVLVAYPPEIVHDCMAEVISNAGLTQFHVAETEKYAHITFFLNGGIEEPFKGEDRKIISSPKVSSYDQAPEMSASKITKEVVKAIQEDKYDVIFVNFANADMVGHTGDLQATIKACEAIDESLGKIVENLLVKDGVLLITADHGNADSMLNLETKEGDKEHSNNPVPFIIIGNQYKGQAGPSGDPVEGDLSLLQPVGMLADVAPTILKILDLPEPDDMTGRPLI
ncbi:2,3-bisphosphoglycerate-independent phosphoglycerate mutase [Patescibacteria group bacterium]|nr:2,3-bisphosphoglycerate-independent phosphoglycerate mutase [Patescibacteria group bacterium]